jgi:gliding motility associated protien GldN
MKATGRFIICALVITGFSISYMHAQAISLIEKKEVYDKEHIPKKDPIPYPFVREADVMYEKVVWRMINLREKMNHPLYFPTVPIGDRRSVTQTLLDILEDPLPGHQVFAYQWTPYGYEFEQPMSVEEIYENIYVEYITEPVFDSVLQTIVIDTISASPNLNNVSRLMIKEKWFFDKRYSTFKVNIIGICPVVVRPQTIQDAVTGMEVPTGEINRIPLFWVYYPEVRYYFSRQEAYNPNNDAQQISFDDLFNQRRFSSYIFKESNVYDNREIADYAKGMDAMFEAERIKNELFIWEHDLWEY